MHRVQFDRSSLVSFDCPPLARLRFWVKVFVAFLSGDFLPEENSNNNSKRNLQSVPGGNVGQTRCEFKAFCVKLWSNLVECAGIITIWQRPP